MKLVIIDYGVGNLSSIKNMLKKLGVDAVISGSVEDVEQAEKLIIPGVGHFDYGMRQLNASGLIAVLNEKVITKKTPVLGICLGVQLFTQSSEEGVKSGLGWIEGKTVAFDKSRLGTKLKIPHMGWTDIKSYSQSKLFTGMYDEPRFYFVHSYHLHLNNPSDVLATSNYGYDFTVGIEHKNILGVQFHPEKSHKFGMKLLENFIKYY